MGQKRTPHLMAKAKRLRADGRSYAEIAQELSKGGKSISKASVVAWLRDVSVPTPSASAAVPARSEALESPAAPSSEPPSPSSEPSEAAVPLADISPDELRAILAGLIRSTSRAAALAEAQGDHTEAKNQRKLLAVFTNQLRQIHSKADEDTETVKVKAADMAAAAERAWSGLEQQANAVLAEVERWPRCSGCGQPHGDFSPSDKSRVRALFERVARRTP